MRWISGAACLDCSIAGRSFSASACGESAERPEGLRAIEPEPGRQPARAETAAKRAAVAGPRPRGRRAWSDRRHGPASVRFNLEECLDITAHDAAARSRTADLTQLDS